VRRLPVITLAVALAAFALPAAAAAHEISVLPPGAATIDAGDGTTARLIHATLLKPGDTLRVAVHPGADALEALLLVPEEGPEGQASASKLPTWEVRDGVSLPAPTLTDSVTHIAYRVLADTSASSTSTIVIRRGSIATRVALLVRTGGEATPFRADHVQRTPRTLLRLQQWAATPASRSSTHDAADHSTFRAWYAAGLAVVALLVAGWWIRSGKVRSRERGVERSRGE
jgi:hypothetical protein